MTHRGEEAALGLIGARGLGMRIDLRLLQPLVLGDVAQDRDDFTGVAGVRRCPVERPGAHFDPDEFHNRLAVRIGAVAADPEFDRACFTERRGIAQRGEISRAIDDMDALEQAVTVQIGDAGAEQRLGRRRHEQHGAVAAVPRDDVGDIARQKPVTVFLAVEQPETGARLRLGAERKAGGIEPGGDDAERREGCRRIRDRRRQQMILAKHDQKPGGAQSEDRSERDHAARRRQRGLERHDDQPDRGERSDAAGRGGDRRHQSGQRQRGQHMRALIAAGTGQIVRDQDRNDEPGESDHFDRARRAADQEIGGKAGERDDAAEKARRNESAMARRGQHVALRGRMDQRVNIVTYRRKQAQFPLHARLSRRAPFFLWARSCQRPLKRKLRSPARGRSPHRRRAQWRIRRNGFRRHGERLVAKIDAQLRVGAEGLPNCRYLFAQIAVSPLIAARNVGNRHSFKF